MINKEQTEHLFSKLEPFDLHTRYPAGTLFVLDGDDYSHTGYAELWVDELVEADSDTVHPLCGYWLTTSPLSSKLRSLGDYVTYAALPGTPEHDLITAYVMWRAMRCDK